jgi:hypothetical protein
MPAVQLELRNYSAVFVFCVTVLVVLPNVLN